MFNYRFITTLSIEYWNDKDLNHENLEAMESKLGQSNYFIVQVNVFYRKSVCSDGMPNLSPMSLVLSPMENAKIDCPSVLFQMRGVIFMF